MGAHARCAVSTDTKQAWGLVLALIVHQTLPLQLVAPQTPLVNVTAGSQEKMEAYARNAVSINTKQAWGLPLAPIVHQTLPLQLVARSVFAKLAGREHTASALGVWLASINS